ncbi:phenylalanyl-tRNA synthetase beta subunit [Kytococcus aerolatus]|uniref:Phenylalanine--tRNA ligase beta subunit n=1 Tax=Kytococcus aerolatus TaxID=592308 RepID=A0A212U327_9MICO|nr:phenylalanine--tRNA ligase subunit beta [Kytococcus aerolatus]SNC72536.1 phenylalanyl-tRNA synthetase beta subunit [Kytococcus aerolatus]
MLIPISWLAEYVDLEPGTTGAEVAQALVSVGFEEESLGAEMITGPVVVGRVLSAEPEPQKNGKTINWCQVDVGEANGTGEPQGIVCGAHNFGPGDLVVVSLPGAVLAGGFAISERKTYGHLSAGMICSPSELGLGDEHDGIIVLPEFLGAEAAHLEPGTDALPLLGLDSETIEVNVTPDRGYAMSLRGLAREYAHVTGGSFRDPADLPVDEPAGPGLPVVLEDASPIRGVPGCDRYIVRTVRGVDPQAPTPRWMAKRLTDAGVRTHGLVVDVTNYVMLALGQPLHAFDAAAVSTGITVRRAEPGEELVTLDDKTRVLDAEDLVITSGGRPVALAGVMGGKHSEVGEGTTDVVLESAHFDAVSVARTARRHRLVSDASKRYERRVDPGVAPAAAQLAVDLLVEHGGGTAEAAFTEVDDTVEPEGFAFDTGLPSRLVGVDYPRETVLGRLGQIGCRIEGATGTSEHGTVTVTPPTWRPDLTGPAHLVEEVARLEGYDQIPSVLPQAPGGGGLTTAQRRRRILADLLADAGLHQAVTLPMTSADRWDALGYPEDDPRREALRLHNPLSAEEPFLRTELLQTLVAVVRRNLARGQRSSAVYELGRVFGTSGDAVAPVQEVGVEPSAEMLEQLAVAVPPQPHHAAAIIAGEWERQGWWGGARRADWSDAVEQVLTVARRLQVPVGLEQAQRAPWHPGRCARIVLEDGTTLGYAGELHPQLVAGLELPERTVAWEVDADLLISRSPEVSTHVDFSDQPQSYVDVALVTDVSVPARRIAEVLREGAGELLESVEMFDRYSGEQVGEGRVSTAWRLTFRAPDRTLTGDEVNTARDAAIARAVDELGAEHRG